MNIKNEFTLHEIPITNFQLPDVIRFAIGYPNPDKISKVLAGYQNPNSRIIGAFVGNELVGAIGIKETDEHILIMHISVIPHFQRQGIGRKLVKYIITMYSLYPILAETDNEAIEFYQRLGFNCIPFQGKHGGLRYKCELKNK